MTARTIQASKIPPGSTIESAICIVGGGVAGLTLACELALAKIDVLVVESGGIGEIPEIQTLSAGRNLGRPYFPLQRTQNRQLGGSANRWCIDLPGGRKGPRLRPLDPIDFEKRPGVAHSGWPIGHADLEPFYERASGLLGFDSPSFAFDEHFAPSETEAVAPRLEKTGFDPVVYKFLYRDDYLKETAGRLDRSPTVRTLVEGAVVELLANSEGAAVTSARCRSIDGPEFLVKADTFIVANGGIQAPRLLLSSRSTNPAGLGNDHDLVGRYFMEHLHFWSGIWIPNPEDVPACAPFTALRTAASGMPVIGKLAPSDATLREHELLNQNFQLIEMPLHDALWHPNLVWDESIDDFRDRDSMETAYRGFRRRLAHWMGRSRKRAFRLANMTEQSPNPDSRVTLSNELDAVGQPRADLDWRIAPGDHESLVRTRLLLKKRIEQAGLGKVIIENGPGKTPPDIHGGDHYMGTTRMHADPKKGVVDADLKVHGVANLYIAGPSVFTTGGYANPIYTMTALTIRLADHLRKLAAA